MDIDDGWEDQAFQSKDMRRLVALHTQRIRAEAIKKAPRRKHASRQSWTSITHNIDAYVRRDRQGWYGNVIVEQNPKVRHAMLQDQGFKDKTGRRHPGRKFLKAALMKSRIP
ncbi:hypothetical protein SMD44_07374 [Streptomyces alboflavus]|uniref:Uncharacterized protein n=1 Tax=Streptomyces alboflavus TaxID=67267 RepID=A0A1Z1WNI6_9ACTN|nr:hypothetical protein [Streptomyces alboflavus]ARX87892.1 hypothetical protein SMD44_07374 [Streptomyces alboflavus]